MKCVITGKETIDKTNSIPLHRDARPLVEKFKEYYNEFLLAEFKKQLDPEDPDGINDKMARELARKVNKVQTIKLIANEDAVMEQAKGEILGE